MQNKKAIILLCLVWIVVGFMLVFAVGGKIPEVEFKNERIERSFNKSDPEFKQYELVKNESKQLPESSKQYANKSAECLALNIYHEARNQGRIGMLLVGHVTMNRVESNRYPNNICDVVYQKKQFSWTHRRSDHTPYETEMWNMSQDIADLVMNRDFDRSKGALFYYNPNLANPKWAKSMQVVAVERDHVFLVDR